MEQLSFMQSEKTLKDKITRQMKRALIKGIIPGAIVYFDEDKKHCYEVFDLVIDNDLNLAARLKDKGSQMSWRADSDRLNVIGFHERRKPYSNTI
mgnify:CR=1 FL=1